VLLHAGWIVMHAIYFFTVFIPFATSGICFIAIGIGQNASIIWYFLGPNSSFPPELAFR
jgi:hypothetical protein